MKESIVVVCNIREQNIDLRIPARIRISVLIDILSKKLNLPARQDYIRAQNPTALLHGDMTAADYGLHDGTILYLYGGSDA